MPDISPADQLRSAADKAQTVGTPMHTALAQWFVYEANQVKLVPGSEMKGRTAHALAVAQQLPGTTTRSYRLEHRHPDESAWQPNTPGIGANWSWESREKADQRLAETRDRWPGYEHRLIATTTIVTETPVVPEAAL